MRNGQLVEEVDRYPSEGVTRLRQTFLPPLQEGTPRGRLPHVSLRQLPVLPHHDDTFIFSNSQANIDTVITNVGKHYEVTLVRDATSFLGLNLAHNADGNVTITQPKLLTKIFALYPPRKDSAHKPSNHPYQTI